MTRYVRDDVVCSSLIKKALKVAKEVGAPVKRGVWGSRHDVLCWTKLDELCHEIAHWMVATPEERVQPWLGLGDPDEYGEGDFFVKDPKGLEHAVGMVTFTLMLDIGTDAELATRSDFVTFGSYRPRDGEKAFLLLKDRGLLTPSLERDQRLCNAWGAADSGYYPITHRRRVLLQLLEAR